MNGAVDDPAFISSSPAFEDVAGDSARLTLRAEVDAHECSGPWGLLLAATPRR
jgi:hypothetical protein